MKNKNNLAFIHLIPIILLGIIAVTVGVGIAYLSKANNAPLVSQATPEPETAQEEAQVPDNWKTYTNENYVFTLGYPSDLNPSESGFDYLYTRYDVNGDKLVTQRTNFLRDKDIVFSIDIYDKYTYQDLLNYYDQQQGYLRSTEADIGIGKKLNKEYPLEGQVAGVFTGENYVVTIENVTNIIDPKVFDTILKSFRFTGEAKEVLLYKDPQGRFTFSYPKGYDPKRLVYVSNEKTYDESVNDLEDIFEGTVKTNINNGVLITGQVKGDKASVAVYDIGQGSSALISHSKEDEQPLTDAQFEKMVSTFKLLK